VQKGLFIKRPDGREFEGKVWPDKTVFPDFSNPATQEWWTKWIRDFMQRVPVDGWWIDMNEPANFCHTADGPCDSPFSIASSVSEERKESSAQLSETQLRFGPRQNLVKRDIGVSADFDPNRPGYKINNGGWEGPLTFRTVGPDALHYNNVLHYDLHNLYGHSESIMTRNSLLDINPGIRPFVLSRSTFSGTGVHAGHWTGDNFSTWESMILSIPGMINFQLFGIPLVGADICGFIGDSTEELCARWMQLGAFYPFSRNHNAIYQRAQEPYLWDSVARSSRAALNIRYSLLPFYYTLFYQSHQFGSTVVRPFFFEFPEDRNVPSYDRQFLVGPSILITPVLEQGARQVGGYFPAGKWYDWYTHRLVSHLPADQQTGHWLQLAAPLEHINVHIRGGYIIPLQKPAMTTFEARKNDFELLVALDENYQAQGDLFIDDGISWPMKESAISYVHFAASPIADGSSHTLTADGVFNYQAEGKLGTVYVLGVARVPTKVYLDDQEISPSSWSFDHLKAELVISKLSVRLDHVFNITWKY